MKLNTQIDVLICGGGASGLAAAIAIKQSDPNLRVCITEKNARVGKKILITGNGRCNIGNAQEELAAYHGTVIRYLPEIWEATLDTESFFLKMGLYCHHEKDGRLYPSSNQAASVLDALRFMADHLGVETRCTCAITNLEKKNGFFYAETANDTILEARAVILAVGGFAAPKTGSDGSSFVWLQRLGHHAVNLKPALVTLRTNTEFVRALKGIRVHALVTAYDGNHKKLAEESGEVQFTERGLSGICVMNLSGKCCSPDPAYLSLQLLPGKKAEQIVSMLWDLYAARAEWRLEDFLTGLFPKKIGIQLLQRSNIHLSLQDPVYRLTQSEIEQIASICQNWCFPVLGRGGWNDAQVTAGGIPVDEIDSTLQSKKIPGLFFAGEMLDLCGDCGGYNLNWAWRSGQYVAKKCHLIFAN